MIYEQHELAKYTKDFIKRRGLKKAFIATECGIRREDFSKWINLHYVLADNEVQMEMSVSAQKKLIVDDTLATNIKKAQAELTNLKSTFSSIGKDPSLSEKWQKLFDSSQVVKSQAELTNLNSKIGLFKKELGGANAVMGQYVTKMVAMVAVMKTIQLVIQGIKAAIAKVEELDSALTEFNKVSDLSADQLKQVTQPVYGSLTKTLMYGKLSKNIRLKCVSRPIIPNRRMRQNECEN